MGIEDCLPRISKKEIAEKSARYQRARENLKVIKVYSRGEMNEILAQRAASTAALRLQNGTCIGGEPEALDYYTNLKQEKDGYHSEE